MKNFDNNKKITKNKKSKVFTNYKLFFHKLFKFTWIMRSPSIDWTRLKATEIGNWSTKIFPFMEEHPEKSLSDEIPPLNFFFFFFK